MAAKLIEYGMSASMSPKANRCDDAPSESFFSTLKNERAHGTTYATRADAQADLFEYIEVFYNRSRRHSTLGYTSQARLLAVWISQPWRRKDGPLEDEVKWAPQSDDCWN